MGGGGGEQGCTEIAQQKNWDESQEEDTSQTAHLKHTQA